MKIVYFDCFSGVSGNMLLGALLDNGLPEEVLRNILTGLNLNRVRLDIRVAPVSGIQAALVQVQSEETGKHRHLSNISTILKQSDLPESVITRAMAVFTRLAEAEALVHNTTVEKIHFHEVGAQDAIVDIVGVVAGLEYLGIDRIVCSALPMPGGWIGCQHGEIPLPAPAVCELLKGIPVYGETLNQELVTPTGAALVVELSHSFGPMPPMTLEQTGYGAGTMQRRDGRPNLLRMIIGETQICGETQQVEVIETHLDDWNTELWPHVSARLMKAGALDVSLVPMLMKKGRPGFLLRILADPAQSASLRKLVLTETSAIGLRFYNAHRMTLPRMTVDVETPWGTVQAKKTETPDGSRITPEYEDCRRIAMEQNVPLQQIYDAIATDK